MHHQFMVSVFMFICVFNFTHTYIFILHFMPCCDVFNKTTHMKKKIFAPTAVVLPSLNN